MLGNNRAKNILDCHRRMFAHIVQLGHKRHIVYDYDYLYRLNVNNLHKCCVPWFMRIA